MTGQLDFSKLKGKDRANLLACTPPEEREALSELLKANPYVQPQPPRTPIRKDFLKALGFKAYAGYLKSDLWRSIRSKILPAQCCRCRRPASQVHHSKYTKHNLSGESLRHLHPVCAACHKEAELRPDGKKRKMKETNKFLGLR